MKTKFDAWERNTSNSLFKSYSNSLSNGKKSWGWGGGASALIVYKTKETSKKRLTLENFVWPLLKYFKMWNYEERANFKN